MRTYRNSTPPEITAKERKEEISTITREYKLITPLFGGGVEPTEYDPVTIIRATEIRGHLRFWWRACRAGDHKTLEELKAAEDAIWGKAHKKGDKDSLKYHQTVQIVVEFSNDEADKGKPERPFRISDIKDRNGNWKWEFNNLGDIHSYAVFPLQPTVQELKQKEKPVVHQIYNNIRFTLVITCLKEQKEAIEDALWAWETFGGLGARTRRGFGALSRVDLFPADSPDSANEDSVTNWLRDRLKDHVSVGRPPEGISYLSRDVKIIIVTTNNSHPKTAWKQLVTKLAEFRQSTFGRSGRGGSRWPEANAIRYIATHRRNQREDGENKPPLLKFPRAAFGLPIVFHFPGEPVDKRIPTLQGAEKTNERLASPIILRPLLCRDNKAVGFALLLDGYQLPPGKIALNLKEKDGQKTIEVPHEVEVKLADEDLSGLNNNGLKLKKTDVLQAFMDYLEGK